MLVLFFLCLVGLVFSTCTWSGVCSCDIKVYKRWQSCGPMSGFHCDASTINSGNSTITNVITITGVASNRLNATVTVAGAVYTLNLFPGNFEGYIKLPSTNPYGTCDTCSFGACQCRPTLILNQTNYYDQSQLYTDVTTGCPSALNPPPAPGSPTPGPQAPPPSPGTCSGPGRLCSGSPPCASGCYTQSSGGYNYCAGSVSCGSLDQAACEGHSSVCSWSGSGSTKCFHQDTLISYGGKDLTLPTLLEQQKLGSPVCVVPHVVKSNGVKITTNCNLKPLRLTSDHLVFVHSYGVKAAGALVVGDVLFQDLEETSPCQVTNIENEVGQTYFGLNCEQSVVLANGIKTSTFGNLHALPALWMQLGSKVIGVERASAWGDTIASFLSTWGFI